MTKQESKVQLDGSGLESATAMGQESLQTMMRSYSAWMQTAAELQTETARFMAERVRKDMEMPARLVACGNPLDVYQEQMDFASTMMSDYSDEGQKIAGILSKAAENGRSQGTGTGPS